MINTIIMWLVFGLTTAAATLGIIQTIAFFYGKNKAKRDAKKAEKELVRQMKEELSKKIAELKKGK